MVDEAIAKALSVNRTLLNEVYLHGPQTYAAYRHRFVTVQPDGAVPMDLEEMRTRRVFRVLAAEVAGAGAARSPLVRDLTRCQTPRQ